MKEDHERAKTNDFIYSSDFSTFQLQVKTKLGTVGKLEESGGMRAMKSQVSNGSTFVLTPRLWGMKVKRDKVYWSDGLSQEIEVQVNERLDDEFKGSFIEKWMDVEESPTQEKKSSGHNTAQQRSEFSSAQDEKRSGSDSAQEGSEYKSAQEWSGHNSAQESKKQISTLHSKSKKMRDVSSIELCLTDARQDFGLAC